MLRLKPSIKILKHLPVKDDESLEPDTGVIFRICGARILNILQGGQVFHGW
jgi:hypothetical protein